MTMRRYRRLIAILALAALATLTAVAMGAAADERFSDWTVLGDDIRMGETIIVDGTLTIQLNGNLSLEECIVRFTNPVQGADRVLVRGGKFTLSDTTLISEVPGRIQVSDDLGRFEVFGKSTITNLDILVKSRGTLIVRNADLVLEGMYTNFTQNDPLTVEVSGKLTVQDSNVYLQYAFLTTTGTAVVVRSNIEASRDYGWEYDGYLERLRFMDGSATISDSTLLELWHGVLAQGTVEATGCEFTSSDLHIRAPWWHKSLEARVEDCVFIASELSVELEEGRADNLALEAVVLTTTITGGSLHLDLNTTYEGELLVSKVTITDHQDYGVYVIGTGFDGSLVLEGLNVFGQRGIQVSGDFSGMVISNSTVTAQTAAMDVSGLTGSIPASITNLTIIGKVGLRVRNAHLEVFDCDLYRSTQPVIGEGGSSLNLVECLLEEEDASLSVAPRDRTATLKVWRHLEVAEVAWKDGPTIDEGELMLFSLHEDLLQPVWSTWRVGDVESPLLRLLEWTLDGDGVEDRFVFHQVRPEMEIEDHTFHIVGTTLDPWQPGPLDLIFLDDAKPFIVLDGDVMVNVSEPKVKLHGSVGDIGTGLAHVRYILRKATGEEVLGDPVDHLAGDNWRTTIDLTGNMQVVELIAIDRAGNEGVLTTRNIQVNVPTPVLTIQTPQNGLLTNDPTVIIEGKAGWYASMVEVQVESADGTKKREIVTVPVVRNAFEVPIELLVEDLNTITLTCFDPFDGNHEVTLTVDLDTIPPLIDPTDLSGLDDNYVNSPSMIIQGRTNDPDAQISILGQVVGLVGDGAFAATVQLAEGRQTIRVTAVDPAGNREVVDLRIILDTKAPSLALLSPPRTPYYTNADEVLVEVTPSESLGSVTIDGEAVDPGSGNLVRTVRPRHGVPTNLVIVATDLAGNEATLSVIIYLDTEPPVLTLQSPNNGLILNTTSIQVVALSNEDGCTIKVDDTPLDTIESRRRRLVGTHPLLGGDGTRMLTITLTDRAGHRFAIALDLRPRRRDPRDDGASGGPGVHRTRRPRRLGQRRYGHPSCRWRVQRNAAPQGRLAGHRGPRRGQGWEHRQQEFAREGPGGPGFRVALRGPGRRHHPPRLWGAGRRHRGRAVVTDDAFPSPLHEVAQGQDPRPAHPWPHRGLHYGESRVQLHHHPRQPGPRGRHADVPSSGPRA